jgi:16S rRNA processing protein RimM
VEGRGLPDSTGAFITLARVIKTQGRHGEVAAEIHSDVPERFTPGMKLSALAKDNSRRELEIEDLWPHKGLLVFKFSGVDSMNDAETLIGAELQLPHEQRAELEQGWTYVSDLVGCTVFDHGKEIGRIEDIQFGAGEAPLLIVLGKSGQRDGKQEAKQYEIPFAEAYLEAVDVAQRRVKLQLPEGMLEINQPLTPEEKREHQSSPERKKKKP